MTRSIRQSRTRSQRIFAIQGSSTALVLALLTFGSGSTFAQDSGLESLKRQSLPWYDAAAEQVRPVELAPRDEPRSWLRGTVVQKKPASKNNWLEDFFESLFGDWDGDWASVVSTFFYWLAWIGIAIAFVLLAIWAFRNLDVHHPVVSEDSKPSRTRAQSVAQLPFQLDENSDDFRSLASKAFQSANYRQAIIWLFSHVLVSLDQRDLIRLKKGKTNRQYLSELTVDRELTRYYADVMVPFEQTFFGDKDLSRSQFEHCWARLEGFEKRIDAVAGGRT